MTRRPPRCEHPRERLLRAGAAALSDAELLAVLLGRGAAGGSALELARELLDAAGGLLGVLVGDGGVLGRPDVGKHRAAVVLAAREVACRITRAKIARRELLKRPGAVAAYLTVRFASLGQEILGVLYLDNRHRLIAEREVFRGTLSRASVEPRPILKEALQRNAAGLIVFHNHPSGDASPSAEDLVFTRRLADAGHVVGVTLIDHIILGECGQWVSLKQLQLC